MNRTSVVLKNSPTLNSSGLDTHHLNHDLVTGSMANNSVASYAEIGSIEISQQMTFELWVNWDDGKSTAYGARGREPQCFLDFSTGSAISLSNIMTAYNFNGLREGAYLPFSRRRIYGSPYNSVYLEESDYWINVETAST